MNFARPPRRRTRYPAIFAACLAALLPSISAAQADEKDESPQEPVESAAPAKTSKAEDIPAKVGLIHESLRRPTKTASGFEKIAADYADFKTRMENDHGLTWSISLSYRQRWVEPAGISSSSQTLFWPSLNWEIFESDEFGAGSFQFLRYAEFKSGGTIKVQAGGRTFTGELPDSRSKFSQITYTHSFPGDRLLLSVGQYSFFNFDSNEFMADQQLNFVNGIFSANGSASYPTSGLGAYLQINARKTLQFIVGGQSANTDSTAKDTQAWLGYMQWSPNVKELGKGQYSLTLYKAPPTDLYGLSNGWSINAAQRLAGNYAVFGRLNASRDDTGNSKHSAGIGLAIDNPLQRAEADQIGFAIGRLEQRRSLPANTFKYTQNTLEAYWNWALASGLLLTPDVQYIRNPQFAPGRDTAWIYSIRTTLSF